MLTVHHLNNSRSQRILWLLEELGNPYEIKFYQRDLKTLLAPEELKKIHPLGKSPVLTDGNLTLAESAAMIEYILDRYGKGALQPSAQSSEYYQFRYWMHYSEGSLMPLMVMTLVFNQIQKAKMPFFIKPVVKQIVRTVSKAFLNPQIKLHLSFIESELTKQTWFAGSEFTAADIHMSFPLEAAASRAGIVDTYPRIADYLKRIHARPAYQKALVKGGPFDIIS